MGSYVEFPGLGGIKFNVDRVAARVFGLELYWYGIIIALSIVISVILAIKESRKYGIVPDNIIDIVLFATPVAIIFARLYYVIFDLNKYNSFVDIINIRNGGLAIYGGVVGAVLATVVICKWKRISVLKFLDFGVPYLILSQAIGRWGNFFNQEAFGSNTSLPWGMTGSGIKEELLRLKSKGVNIDPSRAVHPTFLYECLWNLMVFVFLATYRKKKKFEGEVFCLYAILYGAGRFWIEGLRMDSLMFGNIRISQLLALFCVIAFTVLLILRRKNLKNGNGMPFLTTDNDDENHKND